MQYLNKKQVRYILGIAGIGAVIWGVFKAYQHYSHSPKPQPTKAKEVTVTLPDDNSEASDEEHLPYDPIVEDSMRHKMAPGRIEQLGYLHDIRYRIILSVMKGNSYQGIVNLAFTLKQLPNDMLDIPLSFTGQGIKYLLINGQQLDARDVVFRQHTIPLPRGLLKTNARNHVEIIFENYYSFLNQGLSSYFVIDDHHKYSLRQQVVYTINGALSVQRIIPCFNCLNPCRAQLEVIHPDTFEVISNTTKSLERYCSVTEYQKYPFLFDLSSNSLNKSFKLNSTITGSSCDVSSQHSTATANIYNRKKANTHFLPATLPSVHHLFLFTSVMQEVDVPPAHNPHPLQDQVLIRYFCKHNETRRIGKNLPTLHGYILDTLRRLMDKGVKDVVSKLDVIVIADRENEGYFAQGVILLSERSLSQAHIPMRCFYLVVRALVGMGLLDQGKRVVTLEEILGLNERVYGMFEKLRNYLYLKNEKYKPIRDIVLKQSGGEYMREHEGHFLQYHCKQAKFIVRGNLGEGISFELASIMKHFHPRSMVEFWTNLLSNYNFVSALTSQPLIKLAVRRLGVPFDDAKLLSQLRQCFSSSKYVLNFHTNQEVSDNLHLHLQSQAHGLQARLPSLKVKLKFKDYITEKYEKYLPIKSNFAEAEVLYQQFRRFNELKNFHHYSLLKSEMKRVALFGKDFIRPEQLDLNCSVMGWRLLRRLQFLPADEDYHLFITTLTAPDE